MSSKNPRWPRWRGFVIRAKRKCNDMARIANPRQQYLFLGFCFLLMNLTTILSAQKNGVIFKDITKQAGIDFKYTFGDNSYKNILESSGSGITVFDYNNDGCLLYTSPSPRD